VVGDRLTTGGSKVAANGNGKAPLVLIVDDDPAIRMLCSVNLRIEGLLVLEAPDGGSALEQARSEQPDLVVTDVMMPGTGRLPAR
jgi:CheY-like chemotaxis protein